MKLGIKQTLIKGALAVFMSSTAILANAQDAAQDKKLTLMLDWFVNPNHGPVVIAQQKGYFKEEGLNVTVQEPADPSMPAKLVAANNIDIAISYQTSLTIDVAAGLPLIRASTLIATPLNALMVLDNGKVKTLADLKGKNIGIAIAGNEEATVGTMLASAGVDFSEVKIINVGWALSSSLASGKVDAIWGGLRNFETNQLALEGYKAKSYFPEEHGVPSYDELVFVANANSYDASTLKKFNRALEKATQFIVNHPQQSWETFVTYSPGTLNNELNKRAWQDSLTRFALRPAAVDLQRYDRFSAFMFQHKIITTQPKAIDFVPVL